MAVLAPASSIIPSDSRAKQAQWAGFNAARASFLSHRPATAEELRTIQSLFARESDGRVVESNRVRLEHEMVFIDRPLDAQMRNRFAEIVQRLINRSIQDPGQLIETVCSEYASMYPDTKIRWNPRFVGALRSYGERDTGDGRWETVYASHTYMIKPTVHELSLATTGFPGPLYYGLSTGLDTAYDALGRRYDQLRSAARDFDERLLAEMFLHMLGTRVLHPFWDGHGRIFMAHLALEMETAGVHIREYRDAHDITAILGELNDRMLRAVLNSAGLSFVNGTEHIGMLLNPDQRAGYMRALGDAIHQAIGHGTDPAGDYFDILREAAFLVKTHLVRAGLWRLNGASFDRYLEQVEAHAGQILNVPGIKESEYLLKRFVHYYAERDPSDSISVFKSQIGRLVNAGAEQHIYTELMRLMQAYECADTDIRMATEFGHAFTLANAFGQKETLLALSRAMRSSETVGLITGWPAETREMLVRSLWDVAAIGDPQSECTIEPAVVGAVVQTMDEPMQRFCQNGKDKIEREKRLESMVGIAGYTRDAALGKRIRESTETWALAEQSAALELFRELAELTGHASAVENARILLEHVGREHRENFMYDLHGEIVSVLRSRIPRWRKDAIVGLEKRLAETRQKMITQKPA